MDRVTTTARSDDDDFWIRFEPDDRGGGILVFDFDRLSLEELLDFILRDDDAKH